MTSILSKSIMTIAIIVATFAGASNLTAQTVNMDRYITLTVKNEVLIYVDFGAATNNVPVRIVSGNNSYDVTVNNKWSGATSYATDGTTMTIYGDITGFDCGGNERKITGIDIKNNPKLKILFCERNQLTKFDVSGNTALTFLTCYGNQLDDCALDALFRTLPSREPGDEAKVYIKNVSSSNPGADGCRTPIANAKNWKVMDWNSNYTDAVEIKNTVFTCSTSDLRDVEQSAAVSLYPSPVEDMLRIKTEDEVRSVRIYNIYGAEVTSAVGTTEINLAHLPAGVYVVRVVTDKGIGTQQIVKR